MGLFLWSSRIPAEVGEDYFNLTKNVISYAIENYQMKLMDYLYPDTLYERLVVLCEAEYQCVKKIGIYLYETCHQQMTSQEELYLIIHIHHLLEVDGENRQEGRNLDENTDREYDCGKQRESAKTRQQGKDLQAGQGNRKEV